MIFIYNTTWVIKMAYNSIRRGLKENRIISDYTILDYIHLRIKEESLEEYVSSISITDIGESYYNPIDKHLCINTEEIFYENIDDHLPDLLKLISRKEKNMYKLDDPNYGNIYNIFSVNHEIHHLIQKKEINDEKDTIRKKLFEVGKIQEFIDSRFFNNFYYLKYHDRFYNEYNANIEAYYEMISLIQAYELKNIEKELIKTNKIASKHILYLYSDIDNPTKNSNPIINSLKIYKHLLKKSKKHGVEFEFDNYEDYINKNIPNNEFERLLLGYSINNETYNYLHKVSSGRVKTLNLFNDINC